MVEKLIFGISGVRGIAGKSLTTDIARKLGKAFGTFINIKNYNTPPQNVIAVAKDLRESGPMIKDAFVEGIINTGCDVIDLDDCATPTLLFNINSLKANAGAVITASHNPKEWNGIKFAGDNGCFLDGDNIEKLYEIYKYIDKYNTATNDKGQIIKDNKGLQRHYSAVLKAIDAENIKTKNFKIVFDGCNGVLKQEGKLFLQNLGCKVIEENSERPLEPLAENLTALAQRVKKESADIGFAVDPDGDRLSIVSEKGEAIGEEYTIALVASWLLRERKGTIVTNLSTSRMIEDIAEQNKCNFVRTKVGEINVVKEMKKTKAVFGGEGNGGVIDPEIQYTRDAIVGMGRILEYLTDSGKKLSVLAQRIPEYYMTKTKISVESPDEIIEIMESLSQGGKMNKKDGLRIEFPDSWIHIRKSNTEPIIRIICEGRNKIAVDALITQITNLIK